MEWSLRQALDPAAFLGVFSKRKPTERVLATKQKDRSKEAQRQKTKQKQTQEETSSAPPLRSPQGGKKPAHSVAAQGCNPPPLCLILSRALGVPWGTGDPRGPRGPRAKAGKGGRRWVWWLLCTTPPFIPRGWFIGWGCCCCICCCCSFFCCRVHPRGLLLRGEIVENRRRD